VLLARAGEHHAPSAVCGAFITLTEDERATMSDTERRLLEELSWAVEQGAFRSDPSAGTAECFQWLGFVHRAAAGSRYPEGRYVFRIEEAPSVVGAPAQPTHIVAADVDAAMRLYHEQFGDRDDATLTANAEHPAGATTITYDDPSDAPHGFIGMARRAGGELPFTFAELASLVAAGRIDPIVSSVWF
jgi:hypothetical protein